MNGVVTAALFLGRGVAQHKLGAQFLGNLRVVVVDGVLLFDLEIASPGFPGDLLQDLLAVRTVLLRIAASPG